MSDSSSTVEGRARSPLLASIFGVTAARRDEVLTTMLRATHDRADRAAYWFQLTLAMGIATLGLVLDSTGVVIGAMLVAPLMSPIVHLAMGLVIGSSVLTLRAGARVAFSIAAVVCGAGILTSLLPFHESTREIAARGSPTALDLGVAAFCALAGGFSTLRPGTDTAATAAGTSIGISLVPPLCVVGFGISGGAPTLAEGAALLFVTNLSAILFFCAVYFALMGFRGADTAFPEPAQIAGPADIAARGARSLLGRDYGVVMRIALPLLLVALVFVPLRRSLAEVSWEVRTRGAVRAVIEEVVPTGTSVQSHVDVAHGQIAVRIVMVEHGRRTEAAREALAQRIERSTGVAPTVDIIAVPDLQELRDVAASLRQPEPSPEAMRRVDLDALRRRVEALLAESWPSSAAGRLVSWRLVVVRDRGVVVEVRHDGDALGRAAEAILAREISAGLGNSVTVRDESPTVTVADASTQDMPGFIERLAAMAGALRADASLRLCVERRAIIADAGAPSEADATARAIVEAMLARADTGRVYITAGEAWRARLTYGACTRAASEMGDAGIHGDDATTSGGGAQGGDR